MKEHLKKESSRKAIKKHRYLSKRMYIVGGILFSIVILNTFVVSALIPDELQYEALQHPLFKVFTIIECVLFVSAFVLVMCTYYFGGSTYNFVSFLKEGEYEVTEEMVDGDVWKCVHILNTGERIFTEKMEEK